MLPRRAPLDSAGIASTKRGDTAITGLIPPLLALGLIAIFAVVLTRTRVSPPAAELERLGASRALAAALTIQAIHFAEEALTGFHAHFPALFGLPAMPQPFFLAFNLIWLGFWILSVWGIRRANPIAFFAAWFLAIAAMANLIAHPLAAIAVAGYFPGLITSPLIGIAGIWLWHYLRLASQPRTPGTG